MNKPIFSDDGLWMWDGYDWVAAPEQPNGLPQTSTNLPLQQAMPQQAMPQQAMPQQAMPQQPFVRPPVVTPSFVQPAVQQQPVVQQPIVQEKVMQQPVVPQHQSGPAINVQLLNNRFFPTVKLTVIINDPVSGITEQVSFGTLARTFTSKLANGMVIGKLPLQGITIFSGAQGIITFPNGYSYNVTLNTGLFGMVKGMVITSLSDGRTGMYNF